ncbi:hypothetical protein [Ponticaulis sp.]|jgi:hypothetical protein|uniref:hypothetical protein n=1 Tax=Ponticaulis sp. TaxID=2020902 RepID=UPI000C63D0AA|nr:hypothetical protein [Ponticaulis sp.]MAP22867.1 hypothetical protein [Alteromonadaceae bacterium]MBN05131.1 hypothetical protein [Ponticaulis sp.]|tara:strand:- start:13853 stop:14797 length:945 start_codon:yes stop_codon:yes gene_type:complete
MSITPGYKEKRKFITMALKRPEDTKGTDYIANGATPVAILTTGLGVNPYQSEQKTRDLDDGQPGGQPVIHTGERITITAPIEWAGSGAATTPAAWSKLIQLAARDETVNASDVTHERILSASNELDGTVYFYWEGMWHILLAGKASLTTSGKVGEIPKIAVEIQGIYGDTVSGTPPAANFTAFQQPLPFSKANTTFTLDGQALNLYEYELADNNSIEHDEGTEINQIFIDDWSEEGKFIIEAPALSTFDPFALIRASAIVPFEITNGTEAGKIVKQSSTGIQLLGIQPSPQKGKQCWDISFRVIRGNDSVLTTA